MNGFSDAGSIPAASTSHFHVIGEFIELPHLGKLYCLSGGSVCYGQDNHKIKSLREMVNLKGHLPRMESVYKA